MLQQNYFEQIQRVDLTELDVYQIYGSVKLHFTQKNYDFTKYGVNKKAFNSNAFSNRPDVIFFKRLSDSYQYKDRFLPVVISNMYEDSSIFSKDLLDDECKKRGLNFRAYFKDPISAFKSEIKNLVLSKEILNVSDLYSQNTKTNYFSLQSRKLIQPLTASIMNNLYYTKYLANTSLSFVYDSKSDKLNKLFKFLPEDRINDIITELFVIETIKDLQD